MYKSLEQPSMVRPILYRLKVSVFFLRIVFILFHSIYLFFIFFRFVIFKLTEDVAILRMFMKLFGGIMLKSYLYEFRNDDEIVFKVIVIP
jgi:hypothetical protein